MNGDLNRNDFISKYCIVPLHKVISIFIKVKIGNDEEMAQTERNTHFLN